MIVSILALADLEAKDAGTPSLHTFGLAGRATLSSIIVNRCFLWGSAINTALVVSAIAALGVSCSSPFAPSTATSADTLIATKARRATPTYTSTSTPTPTKTPSPTPTRTPSPTSSSTLGPDFSGASLLGISLLDGGRLMVSVTVPGGVLGDFRAVVQGRAFECLTLADYPNRLYCIGPQPNSRADALIRIIPAALLEPVFEAVFAIPPGQPAPGQEDGAGPSAVVVRFGGALGNNYSPASVTIKAGDTVEWQGGFSIHPLVSDDGLWATVSSGSTFRYTFASPGTYRYYCQVHHGLGMTGEVMVVAP